MKTKKLSKKAQAVLDLARNAEREAAWETFEAFKAKFDGVVFKAEVVSWSKGSTEGLIRGLNGEGQFWLYACNIKGKKTWYPETACVYHSKGQIIDAEVKVFYGSGSIAVSHTEGTVDAEHWERIKDQNLAFRCDESGVPITGLFAKGASL